MIEGKDFKFRDDLIKDEADTVPIEILLPKYENVIFRFLKVGITENLEENSATMKFSFEILKHPLKWQGHDFTQDAVFTQIAGTILNTLILELNPVDRTDNTTQSNTE